MPGRGRAVGGGRSRVKNHTQGAGGGGAPAGLVGDDLLIWYDFTADDGATTLTDISGNDNHGTFGGGTNTTEIEPDWVADAGGRLSFGANNENQIVRLPNLEVLDGNPNFTVLIGAAQAPLGGHSGPWWSLGIQGTNSKNIGLHISDNDAMIWFWGANVTGTENFIATGTLDYMLAMRHSNVDDSTEILRIDDEYAVTTMVSATKTPNLVVSGVTDFGDGHALMKIPDYGFASLRDVFDGNMWAFALWNSVLDNANLSANTQTIIESYAPAGVSLSPPPA